jgi:hypothetical protein
MVLFTLIFGRSAFEEKQEMLVLKNIKPVLSFFKGMVTQK